MSDFEKKDQLKWPHVCHFAPREWKKALQECGIIVQKTEDETVTTLFADGDVRGALHSETFPVYEAHLGSAAVKILERADSFDLTLYVQSGKDPQNHQLAFTICQQLCRRIAVTRWSRAVGPNNTNTMAALRNSGLAPVWENAPDLIQRSLQTTIDNIWIRFQPKDSRDEIVQIDFWIPIEMILTDRKFLPNHDNFSWSSEAKVKLAEVLELAPFLKFLRDHGYRQSGE